MLGGTEDNTDKRRPRSFSAAGTSIRYFWSQNEGHLKAVPRRGSINGAQGLSSRLRTLKLRSFQEACLMTGNFVGNIFDSKGWNKFYI